MPAFTRCQHERSAPYAKPGCAIYTHRPASCRSWSCHYLLSDWPDDFRPDRCGVVVDPTPELIEINGSETRAIQLWAAPGYEDACDHQPVLGIVLAILHQGRAVLWRTRNPEGGQSACALWLVEGRPVKSATVAPTAIINGETAAQRLVRAMRLELEDE